MTYDFDTVLDRRNTGSLKYDFARARGKPEGLLPLWVADMDFAAPPEVLEDIHSAVSHGIFGYTEPLPDYYGAVIRWFGDRFGLNLMPEEILPSPGVVFSLAQAVRAFTRPGDGVLIQTPVYYPFFEIIRDNRRRVAANPLLYENGRYRIDFDDLERQAARPDVTLFLLCSPHNPVGRVWTAEELTRLRDICQRHGVLVAADEIHGDFIYPGGRFTSFGTLDKRAILCTAPTKAFNLAGLQSANIFVRDEALRRKLRQETARSGYSQLNVIGLTACRSAYEKGGPWLTALNGYLHGNLRLLRDFLAARLPQVRLVEPEGTYLLWLDFSALALPQAELDRRITEGAGLWLDSGTMFGPEGTGFQRINIACPRSLLAEALSRLEQEFSQ
ncbi:MAG: pyridoxal phosphate-dependent aminotransferase [Oscillospiraceae bacterium]|nr:pyridoxal phosphate-dependent aminotransferase [Oscillospiraceae bacterium]